MVADVNPAIFTIFNASIDNVHYSFGKIPSKAVDFIADHSFSIPLKGAGLIACDDSIRLGIKYAISVTMIAVGLNALGFSAVAITTAKVTYIAKTIFFAAIAKEVLKEASIRVSLFKNNGFSGRVWARSYVGAVRSAVITAAIFGWNPLVMGVIAAANQLARDSGFANMNSYFVSRNEWGDPRQSSISNDIVQAAKGVFNYAAVTTIAMGALHLVGKVVMQNPQARVAAAVAYLFLANMDPYAVDKVKVKAAEPTSLLA